MPAADVGTATQYRLGAGIRSSGLSEAFLEVHGYLLGALRFLTWEFP